MAAKKKAAKQRTPKKSARKKKASSSRKRITPSKVKRGLGAEEIPLDPDAREIAALRDEVVSAGGSAIGAYREPLSGHPILLASLPLAAIEPTPFQRDLSPTHTKRLAQKIDESGSFLDPLIAVRGNNGRFWTPNGRHRLAAGKVRESDLALVAAVSSGDGE
jgi:ParB family chromosome partitioning protein